MTRRSPLIALILAACVAPSPAPHAEEPAVVVLAAASLTESLQKVATRWSSEGHPKVTLSFDASSRLARQIEAGAPADAFFSADQEWMDYLAGRGLIDPATRVTLLGNALVAIAPAKSALTLHDARDLARPELLHLALAGENVPAGKYARAALESLGVWGAVEDRVQRGDNVRSVLSWVAAGEADAGVVYATDAAVEPAVKLAFTFPESSHPPVSYPAAVLRGANDARSAADFLSFCQGAEGMAVFLAAGFTRPVPR